MPTIKSVNLKGILVLAGVAVITAAIGFATTVQLSARNTQSGGGQDPAVQGGGRGQGMMGRGMMGPGGPGMRGGPGGGPGGMFGPELRALELTDAQREQVKAIMESHREGQKVEREKMMTARKALHDAIAADPFDEAAIRAAAGAVGALDADAAVEQARIRAEIFGILTPEQVKKAKELRTEMENRMKEGRGRGRGMRPHPMPPPEPRAEGDISLPETV